MKSLFALFLFTFSLNVSAAFHVGISAKRNPNESYNLARSRQLLSLPFETPDNTVPTPLSRRGTAERLRADIRKLKVNEVPELRSMEELNSYFYYIRDTRFIETWEPNFPRRATWLFPDDGCFARAEVAKIELEEKNLTKPKKLFVFGDLTAQSNNSPSGRVAWWYHVAPTYRVGSVVYVLDPALEPTRPLMLSEWNSLVGGDSTKTLFSLCAPETFDPESDCEGKYGVDRETALNEQKSFLQSEWDRIVELGRQPEQELGDSPPWLNPLKYYDRVTF